LTKKGLDAHTARVALCLDISMSMYWLYEQGQIAELAKRVLALGLRFDDNSEVDIFLFGKNSYTAGTLNVSNYATFVPSIPQRYPLEPSTSYGAAMRTVREFYFGPGVSHDTVQKSAATPVYVMFVTDGEPTDRKVARKEIMASSFEPIFWQFMAIGPTQSPGSFEPARGHFQFLQELDDMGGRFLDNADFFAVDNPSAISDSALFDAMVNEYPTWIPQARQRGLLT
jgi:hypothetical protein